MGRARLKNPKRAPRTQSEILLIIGISVAVGLAVGLGGFTFVYAKGASYLQNDPAACVNCHIMSDQYTAWNKSSHRSVAVCNDCHARAPPRKRHEQARRADRLGAQLGHSEQIREMDVEPLGDAGHAREGGVSPPVLDTADEVGGEPRDVGQGVKGQPSAMRRPLTSRPKATTRSFLATAAPLGLALRGLRDEPPAHVRRRVVRSALVPIAPSTSRRSASVPTRLWARIEAHAAKLSAMAGGAVRVSLNDAIKDLVLRHLPPGQDENDGGEAPNSPSKAAKTSAKRRKA